MKIVYLGTAAYEGVPVPYCKCRVCRESFRLGGRALRSRSQALVDGELLLDYNADTVCHSLRYRIDWEKIGDCLITHSHSDHISALKTWVKQADIQDVGAYFSVAHAKEELGRWAENLKVSSRGYMQGYEKLEGFGIKPVHRLLAKIADGPLYLQIVRMEFDAK